MKEETVSEFNINCPGGNEENHEDVNQCNQSLYQGINTESPNYES